MKAYLIGNGCSIPYGSPSGSEIFKKALELFYDRWKVGNLDNCYHTLKREISDMLSTMDDLREHLEWGDVNDFHKGIYRDKFEYLRSLNHYSPESATCYNEIKDYLSKYRIWELFPEIISCYQDGKCHGFGNLERKRKRLVEEPGNFFNKVAEFSLKTIYFAIKDSNCNPGYYTNFVKAISNSLENTLIINLNYDNLFEKVLKDNFKGIVEFVFGDKIRCYPSSQFGENTGKRIFLFKPHGSFDFLFCDECKSITISEDVPLKYSQYSTDKTKCGNPDCLYYHKRKLNNFFIPYTDVKLPIKYKDILNSIIKKMKQVLDSIDEITVIGYSFSKYDGDLIDKHLKFIFKNRRVIVVAKDISENKEICSRLKPFCIEAVNSELNGFADFIRHMPSNFFTRE